MSILIAACSNMRHHMGTMMDFSRLSNCYVVLPHGGFGRLDFRGPTNSFVSRQAPCRRNYSKLNHHERRHPVAFSHSIASFTIACEGPLVPVDANSDSITHLSGFGYPVVPAINLPRLCFIHIKTFFVRDHYMV